MINFHYFHVYLFAIGWMECVDVGADPDTDPEFTDIIENITVPAGRNVKLACSVKNLGTYKVRDKEINLLSVLFYFSLVSIF